MGDVPLDLDAIQASIDEYQAARGNGEVSGPNSLWRFEKALGRMHQHGVEDVPALVAALREARRLALNSLGSASAATDLALLRDFILRLTGDKA